LGGAEVSRRCADIAGVVYEVASDSDGNRDGDGKVSKGTTSKFRLDRGSICIEEADDLCDGFKSWQSNDGCDHWMWESFDEAFNRHHVVVRKPRGPVKRYSEPLTIRAK
jgi:hypothetical protein